MRDVIENAIWEWHAAISEHAGKLLLVFVLGVMLGVFLAFLGSAS